MPQKIAVCRSYSVGDLQFEEVTVWVSSSVQENSCMGKLQRGGDTVKGVVVRDAIWEKCVAWKSNPRQNKLNHNFFF